MSQRNTLKIIGILIAIASLAAVFYFSDAKKYVSTESYTPLSTIQPTPEVMEDSQRRFIGYISDPIAGPTHTPRTFPPPNPESIFRPTVAVFSKPPFTERIK